MRRLAVTMALAAGYAFAHHSLHATYLMDQQVTIHGNVTQFLLRNPHSLLQVTAPDGNGRLLDYAVEWSGGGVLGTMGIRRDTLKPGDEVTIVMSPGKNEADHRGLLRIIRRASDGFEWGTKPGEQPQEWQWAK